MADTFPIVQGRSELTAAGLERPLEAEPGAVFEAFGFIAEAKAVAVCPADRDTIQGLLVPAAVFPAVEGVQEGELRGGGLDVAAAQVGAGDFGECLFLGGRGGGGGDPGGEALDIKITPFIIR